MSGEPAFRAPIIRDLFHEAVRQGWRWRRGRHVLIYPPDGSPPIALSTTAYDGPENAKLVALARRHGLR